MIDIFAAIQATSVSDEGWETAKGVMLTISTAATMWIGKTLFAMRDDVRDLKRTVGTDGKNGVLKVVEGIATRVQHIEERHAAIDAVAEAERDGYEGPERRYHTRRMRDALIPPMPPINPDQD